MKIRHLLLFVIACAFLLVADLPGGSLLALFVWLQIALLLIRQEFNKSSQIWAVKTFLVSLPLLLFWGSTHTFLFIYFKESNWLYFLIAFVLDVFLAVLATFYYIFIFLDSPKGEYRLSQTLDLAWHSLKAKKSLFFKYFGLLFLFSYCPILTAEWKLVFAIMATHLYLGRAHLRLVFASGF